MPEVGDAFAGKEQVVCKRARETVHRSSGAQKISSRGWHVVAVVSLYEQLRSESWLWYGLSAFRRALASAEGELVRRFKS
jgi:hypothetical protein